MSLQWYFIWNKSKGPVLATDMLTNTIFNIWAVNIKTNGNIYEIKSMYICLGASQLVTQSPRHLVDLSRSWLVTSKHQPYCRSSNYPYPSSSPRSPPLLKKCTRNWAENKVKNKAHAVFCSLHMQGAEQRVIVWICDHCSKQLLCTR